MRHISHEGMRLIKKFEGLALSAYLCPAKIWTIGYGHTATAKQGQRISVAEANRLLALDLEQFASGVEKYVRVALTDPQFSALVAFAYNIGLAAFSHSTLLRKLNAGDYGAVPAEMRRWNKVQGKVLAGLQRRREAEIALWQSGDIV